MTSFTTSRYELSVHADDTTIIKNNYNCSQMKAVSLVGVVNQETKCIEINILLIRIITCNE